MNDRKGVQNLPIMTGVIYVFDRAYDDYSWYYEITKEGTHFADRMKTSAVYEVIETGGLGQLNKTPLRLHGCRR